MNILFFSPLQKTMPVFHKPMVRSAVSRNCSVCMHESRDATRLSCDHTFCQPCIRSQVDRISRLVTSQEPITIVCSSCRDFLIASLTSKHNGRGKQYVYTGGCYSPEPVRATRPKSAYVPSDARASYSGKPQRCQPCAEGQEFETATFWCQNCSEYLCSVCARYHQAMKMSHDHVVKTIRDKERYGNIKSKVAAVSRPQTAKDIGSSHLNCEPCNQNRKTKSAQFMCQQCKEQMCAECTKCHQSMKMSKTHRLLPMKEVLSKSESRLSLDMKCDRHKGEFLSLYCKPCRVSCCAKCAATNHTNCGNTVKLEPGVTTLGTKVTSTKASTSQTDKAVHKLETKVGPISYSWDSICNPQSEDKTVAFTIKSDPKSRVTIQKNRMAPRKKRIDVEYCKDKDWVISFAVLSTGDILLIQLYEPMLKMISSDGDLLDTCRFYGDPWSVAAHNDSLAIVSFSGRKQLQLVHITRKGLELGRKLAMRHKALAVCFAKNLIVASCWEGCIHLINISGEEVCCLDSDHNGERLFTNPEYIASDVHGSVVYVSDFKRNCVTALLVLPSKINNKPIFVFRDPDLKGPKGVAVDKNGVVYVSGMSSRNIFRLSASGSVIQVYRRREDTEYYEAIAVTRDSEKLLVSAYEDCSILEFKLSH